MFFPNSIACAPASLRLSMIPKLIKFLDMKLKALVFLSFLVGLLLSGCSRIAKGYSYATHPATWMSQKEIESSLNLYNTHWDNFHGHLEKGKIYHYSDSKFEKSLRFEVLQVLSEKEILVIRSADEKTTDEFAILYVISDTQYADDSTLLSGDYVCIGRYQYTNGIGRQKTVYALAEKSFYDKQMKNAQ